MDIFCPNNHLVLAENTCKKCGWTRQSTRNIGGYRWGPIELLAGFCGNSVDKYNTFTVVGQTLLFVLRSNEIVGVSTERGSIIGRTSLPKGQVIKSVKEYKGKAIITVQDVSSLMEKPVGASLKLVSFKSNELVDFYVSESHDITTPLFKDQVLYIRESNGQLKAIDTQTDEIIWEQAMEGWHAYPLIEANGSIVVVDGNSAIGELSLKAFDMLSGELVWQRESEGQPLYPIVNTEQQLFVVQRKSKLEAISSENGTLQWHFETRRIYTHPVLYGNELVLSTKHEEEGYQIVSLDIHTGEVNKKVAMETSIRFAPILDDDTLYTVDGTGYLNAYNWQTGARNWRLEIANEQDPFDAMPKLVSDTLVVGTYTGKLSAIVVQDPEDKTLTPMELIEKNDFEGAAKAFALQGHFAEAAQVYRTELNDENRAMQLLDHGGHYNEAAEIAFMKKYYSLALDYYRKADNTAGKARTYEAMGDPSRAADLYLEVGESLKAAKLFEEAGKPQEALKIYIDNNALDEYKRLIAQVDFNEAYSVSSERLRHLGDFETVARWAFDNKQYLVASRDFAEAGLHKLELESLKCHLEQQLSKNETLSKGIWYRLAELGDTYGDYAIAGRGWIENDRLELAGQAYYKHASILASGAAEDINQIPEKEREAIAHYFKLAADAFAEEGQDERQAECEQQVRRFLQLPKVVILVVKSEYGFREQSWNELYLTVKNIGFGSARDIDFHLDTKYFEIEGEEAKPAFNLAAGRERIRKLHIKPLKGETGMKVPLYIRWTYLDRRNNVYKDEGSSSIDVAGLMEDTSKKPIIYNFQNVDTLVTGTVGSLDKSTGDRVEINRRQDQASEVKVRSGEDEIAIGANPFAKFEIDVFDKCPKCGEEMSELDDFCKYCGSASKDFEEKWEQRLDYD
jgi:outer membrane protein assembly factor BamB